MAGVDANVGPIGSSHEPGRDAVFRDLCVHRRPRPAAHPMPDDDVRSPRRVAVLGATGTIGHATLDVIAHLDRVDPRHRWVLTGGTGHHNLSDLAALNDHAAANEQTRWIGSCGSAAAKWCGDRPLHACGADAVCELAVADDVDVVVAAIVGAAGLPSTLAAARAGKRIALANKEALVVAGPLLRREVAAAGSELLPVDSEHSAILQSLGGGDESPTVAARRARRYILTASGGPFRESTTAAMRAATPDQAAAHPTWNMGQKISIDSATMMNKALEIIEARWLFDIDADAIEVMIHPQSIIHSMIETHDGSVIAQLSPPDMKLPIQLALLHPRRLPSISPPLRRDHAYDLRLEPVDRDRFPAIDLGFEVAAAGGTAGAVVNGANERAVELFLERRIGFLDIVTNVRNVLENHHHETDPTLDRLLELDKWSRQELERIAA